MATLKEHIATCDERYKNIEARLGNLDKKIDEIHHTIDGFKTFLIQFAFKSFVGLFLAICAAVFVIKM